MMSNITAVEAAELWDRLRQHLIHAERALEEIIETRAWEPMGYSSFAEAWDAQNLSDITFAPEVRAHVVYALLDGGLAVEEVASEVKGVGVDRVESLARQKSHGVPASDASLAIKRDPSLSLVSEHVRKPATARGVISVEFGPLRMATFRAKAKHLGLSVEDIARGAIEAKFDELP